jgi:hypothetical protein
MGPVVQGEFSVIHNSITDADFDNFSYGAFVVTDIGGGVIQINGTSITVPNEWEGQVVPMMIKPIGTLGDADLFFLGNPKPVGLGPTGQMSGVTATANAVWQFINIKTGLPTNG